MSAQIFRVFVSSTFSDMEAERNALQERVYPRLNALCLQHGTQFQAVDLRWGVSYEAGLDQRAVSICMEEIRRCQQTNRSPNFLLLLGDRSGWQPLPEAIPTDEFNVIESKCLDSDDYDLLHQWYHRDDNAVPSKYVLQPRRDTFTDYEQWTIVEKKLVAILQGAVSGLDWSQEQMWKYTMPITEQEIQAGIFEVENAQDSAYCFFRVTESNANDGNHDLKQRLRDYIPDNVADYNKGDIDGLCDAVYTQLSKVIQTKINTFKEVDSLHIETQAHKDFMEDRRRHFTGRTAVIDAVHSYINSDSNLPLLLHGQSGVGKSTIMAQAISQTQVNLFYRFIGVTPDASDIQSVLQNLCQKIVQLTQSNDTIPNDYDELILALPKFLSQVNQPMVIFLDALDQLSEINTPFDLRWLPRNLPPQVKLVLSCTPSPYLDNLQRQLSPSSLVEITPMSIDDAQMLLNHWLTDMHRTLQPNQQDEIIKKFKCNGLPLYLKLAFEEARHWRSYDPPQILGDNVVSLLRDNLFSRLGDANHHGQMLVSHSMAYIAAARNGLSETELLDVLASDDDYWHDFLDHAFHQPLGRQVPTIVWSRLYFDLAPYLIERSADNAVLMDFYHRQFSEAVNMLYLSDDVKTAYHAHLASYFESQPLYINEHSNERKLTEQPYHQAKANLHDAWKATLMDVNFLQAGVNMHRTQMLIEACEWMDDKTISLIRSALMNSSHILSDEPAQCLTQIYGRLSNHQEIHEFLQKIVKHPTIPALWSTSQTLEPADGALIRTIKGHKNSIKDVKLSKDGRFALSYCDHELLFWNLISGEKIHELIGIQEGKEKKTVKLTALSGDGKVALSVDDKNHLTVWDTISGQPRYSIDNIHRLFRRYFFSPHILQVKLSDTGKYALCRGSNGSLYIIDVINKQGLQVIKHWSMDAIFSHDEKYLFTVSHRIVWYWKIMLRSLFQDIPEVDHTDISDLCVWDIATGQQLNKFEEEAVWEYPRFSDTGEVLLVQEKKSIYQCNWVLRDTINGQIRYSFKYDFENSGYFTSLNISEGCA